MSQLLARLRSEYATVSDPLLKAELAARIAANLARLGRFEEARAGVAELRTVYGDGRSGRITVWIMLAEGLIYLYEDLNPLALDRITRSQVLALAMRYSTVVALSSAWKAHLEFEMSNFEGMATSLKTAKANVAAEDHEAHTRIAMVMSNAFMVCGEEQESYKWFMRGRDHALKAGDQASLEALLYNRAAMVLGWLRVAVLRTPPSPERMQRTRSEVKSARNLQSLTGISTMENHVTLMEARLLTLDGKYMEAIAKLQSVRDKSPFAERNFSQTLIDFEVCYCLAKAGQVEPALVTFKSLNLSGFGRLDTDERIVAFSMLSELCKVDERFGSSIELEERLAELQTEYAGTCASLRDILEPFLICERA